jgi:hypothetical protein
MTYRWLSPEQQELLGSRHLAVIHGDGPVAIGLHGMMHDPRLEQHERY